MLGQILDDKFSNLLCEIAIYFQLNEQKDFESLEPNNENLLEHDYLKYIDLAIALQDYVTIDFEVAKRLYLNPKYSMYIRCDLGDMERDRDNPNDYATVCNLVPEYVKEVFSQEGENYIFILNKY